MSNQTDQPVPTEPPQEPTAPNDETNDQSTAPPPTDSQTYRQIAATHIDTLSSINAQLPKLLAYFAAVISQLTNDPLETPISKDKPDTPRQRQESMWLMTLFLGKCIGEIREELVTQINDLERYGVIPAKHPKYTALPAQGQVADPEASVKNGGYGDFDVGVLNARAASGHVGGEDVLDRVKTMVEDLMRRSGVEAQGEEMVVDG